MSFWIFRRDRSGRRQYYSVSVPLTLFGFLLSLIALLIVALWQGLLR